MSIPHSYYEELCVLAAVGQITHDDCSTLKEHTQTCEECRCALIDFRYVVGQILPECAPQTFKVPADMTPRFIARARSEGIPLPLAHKSPAWSAWFPTLRLCAELVGTGLILALSSNYLLTHWRAKNSPAKTDDVSSRVSAQDLIADHQRILEQLHSQLTESEEQIAAKQATLESTRAEVERLARRDADVEQTNVKLRQEIEDRNQVIAQINAIRERWKADLDNLRSAKAADDLLFQAHQSEVDDLHSKISVLTAELNEREHLSAAAEEAKDLIVARSLHIVDVHDNNNGNRPRPFGRIFYTEGKKLVFYAYDLDAKPNARVTFYAWGEKSGTTQQAKHLGILHADDKSESRWVVTFDDASVLAQINTVFVTAESSRKEPNKPSANRILVAFIDGAPNHP